jgi:hypothetical protein
MRTANAIRCALTGAAFVIACRHESVPHSPAVEQAARSQQVSRSTRPNDKGDFDEYEIATVHQLPPLTAPPVPPGSAPQPKVTLVRVLSGTTFMTRVGDATQIVTLAGVRPPGACGEGFVQFDDEAQRFLASRLEGNEIRLFHEVTASDGTLTAVVRAVSPQRYANVVDVTGSYVNIDVIQNGYGCAGISSGLECSRWFPEAERIARERRRGMWRVGEPLPDSFVSAAQNALADLRASKSNRR